jgi:hypothetical protein
MGQMIVDKVIGLLSAGGIRADAAYPAERITRITEPVAAVSLENADFGKQTVTVLVELLASQEKGGYLCQKRALEASAILEEAGAVCSQGSCTFLPKGHMFRVPIRAVFRGVARTNTVEAAPGYTITTGELELSYACGFSSEQELKSETTALQETPWEFTVEEFFPWGVADTLAAEEPFTLDLTCKGRIERYSNCKWLSRKRVAEEKGIRQFRTGRATARFQMSE